MNGRRSSNAIGAVSAVHGLLAKQFLDPADIRNNPAAGGGALYDLGSYAISACNLILDRQPLRVVAALERDPAFGVDRLTSALLDYGDRHATLTVASQSGPAAWATHLTFLSEEIRRRANECLEGPEIREVRVVVGPPRVPGEAG